MRCAWQWFQVQDVNTDNVFVNELSNRLSWRSSFLPRIQQHDKQPTPAGGMYIWVGVILTDDGRPLYFYTDPNEFNEDVKTYVKL